MKYKDAQIYMTTCTHPDYKFIKYIGLDTKRDPSYIGSSVVLKWFVGLIGKSYFSKTILDTLSGDMSALCELEQTYISKYNAVRDPNFLNMNGVRNMHGVKDMKMNMDYRVTPETSNAKILVKSLFDKYKLSSERNTFTTNLFAMRILNMVIYGYLKYSQTEYEYSLYDNYKLSNREQVDSVISTLNTVGYIEKLSGKIEITQRLVDSISMDISAEDFTIELKG